MRADAAMMISRRRKGPDMSKTARGRFYLNRATRHRIKALIETLISILDEADGDPDEEDDDPARGAEDNGIVDRDAMLAEDGC